jgi:hypothetical protein
MNAFIFTLGVVTFIAVGTYLIYKLLVAIKLIVIGKVWKTLSKPTPEYPTDEHGKTKPPKRIYYRTSQVIQFLKLIKNEKLVTNPKPLNHFEYDSHTRTDNKTVHPVSKFVKSNLDNSGHNEDIISDRRIDK